MERSGVINIYKEAGYTSHDVVAKLRGILKQKKIGHTGTLDPQAQGVLPVCLGKGTKLCDLLADHDKEYEAVLRLGITTDTQDMEGNVLQESSVQVSEEEVRTCILSFQGEQMQVPPMYSALKVNGKKEDASFRLSRGDDVVSYVLEEKKNTEPVILYEDENLLAAVKPAGLLSLDPEGKEKDTLLTRVNKYLEGKGEAPAIPVHRIDFHTEGILLFAKNRPAADVLEGLIRDRKIGKTYLAVVTGRVQNSKGRLEHQLFKDAKQNKVFVSEERIKGSKTAITEYERMAATGDLTLVKCHLITGRTHQIRTQLAHIGHPILGDDKYGFKALNKEYKERGQLLCAYQLSFDFTEEGGILSYLSGKTIRLPKVAFVHKYFSGVHY